MARLTLRQAVVLYETLQEELGFQVYHTDRDDFFRHFSGTTYQILWLFSETVFGYVHLKKVEDRIFVVPIHGCPINNEQEELLARINTKLSRLVAEFIAENEQVW